MPQTPEVNLINSASKTLGIGLENGFIDFPRGRNRWAVLCEFDVTDPSSQSLLVELEFIRHGNPYLDIAVESGNGKRASIRLSHFNTVAEFDLAELTAGDETLKLLVHPHRAPFKLKKASLLNQTKDLSGRQSLGSNLSDADLSSFNQLITNAKTTELRLIEHLEIPSVEDDIAALGLNPEIVSSYFSRSITYGEEDDRYANEPIVDVSLKNSLLSKPFGRMRSAGTAGGEMFALASVPLATERVVSVAYEFWVGFPIVIFSDTSFAGTISAVWMPTKNVLFFDRNYWSSSWMDLNSVVEHYRQIINEHGTRLDERRGTIERALILSKTCKNMGHFFYNELCGVLSIPERTDGTPFDVADLAPLRWISLKDYLPEDRFNVVDVDKSNLLDLVINDGVFLVRATATRIKDKVAAQIGESALAILEHSEPARFEKLKALRETHHVLFVNLRAHNKAWARQVDGLVDFIADYRCRINKPLAVYFDGFEDCLSVYEEIVDKADGITPVNGLSVSMTETLCWAYGCDFFIGVIGSGLVPLTWLADRPGICFAELQHMKQLSFWGLVREASSILYHPDVETITQTKNVMYSNFDFPQSELTNILDKHFAQK